MSCSVRHNVKEILVGEGLVKLEDGKLVPNVAGHILENRAVTMARSLSESHGTEDIPFLVTPEEVVLNDDLFTQIDGVAPEVQENLEDELIASMRHLMRQLGISENVVSVLKDREGNPIQGVAAADLINRSIQYLEGKESELPEEVIHFYVQALKDTSDPLYTSMRARIASEPEYEQVTRDYQNLEYTQEDIIDEAIAKVILNRVRPQVKTGVSELFESNPELANAVYEALGFKIKLPFIEGKYTKDDDFLVTNKLKITKEIKESRFYLNYDGSQNIELKNIYDKIQKLNVGDILDISDYTNTKSISFEELTKNINFNESNQALLNLLKDTIKTTKFQISDKFLFSNAEAFYSDKYNTIGIKRNNINNQDYLLHEILHAATFRKISYFEENKKGLADKELQALNELENIRKILKEKSDNYWEGKIRRVRDVNPLDGYRVDSIHEIISYAFTDKSFRDAIADIPYKGNKSILDKLVELIANIFGVKQDTILQALLANTEVLLENTQITPQQKQQAQQLYSQYLDTIFPDSKVKDIVYRGGNITKEEFAESEHTPTDYMDLGVGLYLSPSRRFAGEYGNPRATVVNIKNPKDVSIAQQERADYSQKEGNYGIPKLDSNGKYDGIVDLSKKLDTTYELVVFEPEQIHILGSKQDIEGFKAFVQSKQSITPRKGISELFSENPELATIGTQEQYERYLSTIFPDSKVKDIVYHGTKGYNKITGEELPKFEKFDKSFIGKGQGLRSDDMAKGFYFGSYKIADRAGTRVIPAILNIQEETNTTVRRNTKDFDTTGDVFVVFEPEQIHILGSKQDIEGFKAFVSKGKSEDTGDRNTRWWNRVLKRLREMFGVGTEKTDPFKEAALEMFRRDLTQYRDVVSSFTRGTILRSVGSPQDDVRNAIVRVHNSIKPVPVPINEAEPVMRRMGLGLIVDKAKAAGEKTIDRYQDIVENKMIWRRATDRHQVEYLKGQVQRGQELKSPAASVERIRLAGTKLHNIMEGLAYHVATNDKYKDRVNIPDIGNKKPGTLKELQEESGLPLHLFKKLVDQMKGLADEAIAYQNSVDSSKKIDMYTELRVASRNTDTAGTIDLLFVASNGKGLQFDYKFMSPNGGMDRAGFLKRDMLLTGAKLEGYMSQAEFYRDALRELYGIQLVKSRLVPGTLQFGAKKDGYPIRNLNIGISDDRYLMQVPVAEEIPGESIDSELGLIYDELKQLDERTSGKLSEASRARLLLLRKTVKELLNDSDMQWSLADMKAMLDTLKGRRKKGETMAKEELADMYNTLKLFQRIHSAAKTRGKFAKDSKMKKSFETLIEDVDNMEKEILSEYHGAVMNYMDGYDLRAVAAPLSSFTDNMVSFHTLPNQILSYAMMRVSEKNVEVKELERKMFEMKFLPLRDALEAYAKSSGNSMQELFDMMIESDSSGLRLARVMRPEFHREKEKQFEIYNNPDSTEAEKRNALKWIKDRYQIRKDAKAMYDEALERRSKYLENRYGKTAKEYEYQREDFIDKRDVFNKDDAWMTREGKRYLELKEDVFMANRSDKYLRIESIPELKAWYNGWKEHMEKLNDMVPSEFIRYNLVPMIVAGTPEILGQQGISEVGNKFSEMLKRSFVREKDMDERTGQHTRTIPLRYLRPAFDNGRMVDPSLYNRDLFSVLQTFTHEVLKHHAMSSIEGEMRMLKHMLSEQKIGEEKQGKLRKWLLSEQKRPMDGGDPTALTFFEGLMQKEIYGQRYMSDTEIEIGGTKLSVNKMLEQAMSGLSTMKMTMPVRAAIAALGAGVSFSFSQVENNPNFAKGSYQKALRMKFSDTDRYWALVDRFDGRSETRRDIINRRNRSTMSSRLLDSSYRYQPLIMTDNHLHANMMVALLDSHAIVDGKLQRMEDMPENGTWKSIAESLVIKDGQIEDDIPIEIVTQLMMVHAGEMRGVSGTVQKELDHANYEVNIGMRVLMQFKGWMPGLAQARLGDVKYTQALRRLEEGRYRGTLKSIMSRYRKEDAMEGVALSTMMEQTAILAKDALMELMLLSKYTVTSRERAAREKGGKWAAQDEQLYQNRRKHLMREFDAFRETTTTARFQPGMALKGTEKYNLLFEEYLRMREASVRSTMMEARQILSMMLISILLGAAFDDDDEYRYASSVSQDILGRTLMEMAQFVNPIEMGKVLQNGIPLLGLLEQTARLGGYGVDYFYDVLTLGPGEAPFLDSPLARTMGQFVPGHNMYRMFIKPAFD